MTIDDSANATKNSYSGGTILSNGGLIINSNIALGNATAIGTGPLTITSSGGPTLLGSTATPGTSPGGNPNTALVLGNTVNIEGDFSISNPTGDFIFAGPVNLNPLSGTANTITGLTPAGQIHFSGGIIGANSLSNRTRGFHRRRARPGLQWLAIQRLHHRWVHPDLLHGADHHRQQRLRGARTE